MSDKIRLPEMPDSTAVLVVSGRLPFPPVVPNGGSRLFSSLPPLLGFLESKIVPSPIVVTAQDWPRAHVNLATRALDHAGYSFRVLVHEPVNDYRVRNESWRHWRSVLEEMRGLYPDAVVAFTSADRLSTLLRDAFASMLTAPPVKWVRKEKTDESVDEVPTDEDVLTAVAFLCECRQSQWISLDEAPDTWQPALSRLQRRGSVVRSGGLYGLSEAARRTRFVDFDGVRRESAEYADTGKGDR